MAGHFPDCLCNAQFRADLEAGICEAVDTALAGNPADALGLSVPIVAALELLALIDKNC